MHLKHIFCLNKLALEINNFYSLHAFLFIKMWNELEIPKKHKNDDEEKIKTSQKSSSSICCKSINYSIIMSKYYLMVPHWEWVRERKGDSKIALDVVNIWCIYAFMLRFGSHLVLLSLTPIDASTFDDVHHVAIRWYYWKYK